MAEQKKTFNDPIHGSMEFHPLIVKVMNTREFQRLKDIKQLGMAYFVYPAASHNRFEHSLGTCYLAGKLTRHLCQPTNHPTDVKINAEVDVLCVELAGLCHDLGHGPFSHLYDDIFLQEDTLATGRPNTEERRRHERRSCDMLDHLIKKNRLEDDFSGWRIEPEQIDFIKCMIDSTKSLGTYGHDKSFLAEIISNTRNGVDVDKFDYLARDCYMTGLKSSFDHERFMKFMKVLPDDKGELQLCTRDKETKNIYELFHVRTHLHARLCSHEAAKVVEVMLSDAFLLADEHLCVGKDENGKPLKLSNAYEDMECFSKLTDSVFHKILDSDGEDLKPARDILVRILNRKLYKRFEEKAYQIKDLKEVQSDPKKELSDVQYAHKIEKQISKKIGQEEQKKIGKFVKVQDVQHVHKIEKQISKKIGQEEREKIGKFVKVQIMRIKFGGGKSVKNFKVYAKSQKEEVKEEVCKEVDERETSLYGPQEEEKILLLVMYTEELKTEDPKEDGSEQAETAFEERFEQAKTAFKEWKDEYEKKIREKMERAEKSSCALPK